MEWIKLEILKGQLKDCIDMIERAGADARFDNDRESYDSLLHQLDGAIYWSNRAKGRLHAIEKELEKENQNDKRIIN